MICTGTAPASTIVDFTNCTLRFYTQTHPGRRARVYQLAFVALWEGSTFGELVALEMRGYTGFGLSVIPSVLHNLVSAQYIENKLIEFH